MSIVLWIMRKLDKFFYFFNKDYEAEQAREKIRRVKTLISFSYFLAGLLYLYSIGTYIKLGHVQLSVIEFVIASLCTIIPFIYKKTGNFVLSTNLLVFCGVAILSAASFYSGGIHSPVIFWIALCPMCAGMIRGKGSVISWGIISILVPISFAIFDSEIQKFPYMIRDEDLIFALRTRAIYGTIILSIVLNWMYKKFIEDMVEQLTDANIQIQNFIRVLGHDIANPLTIVLGNSTMGVKVATTDKEKRLWQRTSRASQTIDDILKEVLTLQAIESGKISLNLLPVKIENMFNKAQFVFEDKLNAKGIKLNFYGDKNLEVLADEVSFSNQVLNNLISNAIKFSDKDSEIKVTCNDQGDHVEISVTDSGVGIPQEILDNLFNYQFKTSRKGTDGESGTGFGMPLVKFFVEKYDGTLTVTTKAIEEYKVDHGTTFTIRLKKPELNALDNAA